MRYLIKGEQKDSQRFTNENEMLAMEISKWDVVVNRNVMQYQNGMSTGNLFIEKLP